MADFLVDQMAQRRAGSSVEQWAVLRAGEMAVTTADSLDLHWAGQTAVAMVGQQVGYWAVQMASLKADLSAERWAAQRVVLMAVLKADWMGLSWVGWMDCAKVGLLDAPLAVMKVYKLVDLLVVQ